MKTLVDEARAGNPELKGLLTNKFVLHARDDENQWLFWRGTRAYPTITKAADNYCRKYWGASVVDVVKGIAPEPETGEIHIARSLAFLQAYRPDHGESVIPIIKKDLRQPVGELLRILSVVEQRKPVNHNQHLATRRVS